MELSEIIDKVKNFPYCPGCGHTGINMALARAIKELELKREDVLIVSDIGCVGLVDKLFNVHTVHGLHGRSTAVASGVKMVDEILFENNLKTVVMIGDGGATIGLLHLVEAAKMNIDVTVLIHNNFLYGMTGGQHSGLTPEGFITSTTRGGNPFEGLRIIEILKNSGAGFYARTTSQDPELKEIIKEAINYNGFSVVEILELCTGYATRYNKLKGSDLKIILEKTGGKIKEIKNKKSFGNNYKEKFFKEKSKFEFNVIESKKEVELKEKLKIVIAGSAGEGVQFASSLLALSGIIGGLYASQKNDNPVTVGSGFSVSEIILSKERIRFAGIESPDYLLITSNEGFNRVKGIIEKSKVILIDESLPDIDNSVKIPSRKYLNIRGGPTYFALGVLFGKFNILKVELFENAVLKYGKSRERVIEIFKKGVKFGREI